MLTKWPLNEKEVVIDKETNMINLEALDSLEPCIKLHKDFI